MTTVKLQTCNFACFACLNARGTGPLCRFTTETTSKNHSQRKQLLHLPRDAVELGAIEIPLTSTITLISHA